MYIPRIRDGVTTEQHIREWFGQPWMSVNDSPETRRFVYLTGGKGRRLDVTFTQEGIVSSHSLAIPTEGPGGR